MRLSVAEEFPPEILDEWFDDALDPFTTSAGSHKKARWRCRQGHVWEATIANRRRGDGCPKCLKNTQLSVAEVFPSEILDEWFDDTLDPFTTPAGSHKKARWRCRLGHVWEATIANRKDGNGCPKCAGRIGLSVVEAFPPEVLDEWFDETLDPFLTPAGSNKKVIWRCRLGHVWEASILSRKNGTGCPKCAGLLGLSVAEACQDKLSEWFDSLDPREISIGSHKKVKWKCQRGHVWSAAVFNRCRLDTGCKECYLQDRRAKSKKKFDGTGRKGSSSKSPRRSTRGGSSFDLGPSPL